MPPYPKGVFLKRIAIVCLMLFCFAAVCLAQDGNEASSLGGLSTYKPMYFSFGFGSLYEHLGDLSHYSDELVKVSFSMKYDPFHQIHSGFFLAYSQIMFWNMFSYSGPFEEIDFNPEVFYRFQSGYNPFGDVKIPLFDFLQIGWEHKSNGQNEPESRGFDRVYGQLQLGLGEKNHFALNAKYFYMIDILDLPNGFLSLRDNQDIQNYTSSWEFQALAILDGVHIFFVPKKIVFSIGPGGGANAFDFSLGWQQLDVYFLKVFGDFRPYVQIWNGYGQSMVDYNEPSLSAHVGLALDI